MMLAAGPPSEPRHVRFRLADGVQVSGELTLWDAEGFDGSFGRRLWIELMPGDAWRLYLAVMDQKDAHQWVDLGRVLLVAEDGDVWAERAFRRALRLDASTLDEIRAARDAAHDAWRKREQLDRTIEDQRLRTRTPEAGSFPTDPWPILSPAEQQAAVLTMEADAEQLLRPAGVQLKPVRTDRFLVYGDVRPLDVARLATRLEAISARLAGFLDVDADWSPFWGKAVAFYFRDHDRFRMVEADSFDQLVPARAEGICHPIGPKVFLCFRAVDDGAVPARSIAHELVHGYMHRYRTPRRLPLWANEGLADFVAAQVTDSPVMDERRERALGFIRRGDDVAALLDRSYDDGPDPDAITAAVGTLLVELMIDQRPPAFGPWVDAVKYGKDWEQALAEDYGVPRAQLVETFVQFYRVND
jgi:hypothetical protein